MKWNAILVIRIIAMFVVCSNAQQRKAEATVRSDEEKKLSKDRKRRLRNQATTRCNHREPAKTPVASRLNPQHEKCKAAGGAAG